MRTVTRRQFVTTAAAAGATLTSFAKLAAQTQAPVPIIDAHIHLFDGARPIGAGYMGSPEYRAKSNQSLPGMYAPLARPAGIVGAIVVESSPWIDENLWYLEVCRADPFMVGVCGSLDPSRLDFGQYLARFHKDPLYRAIRFSRFYATDNGRVTLKPDHVANLKLLAQADLALDTANPSMELMQANALLAEAIPTLRIVMDHLPSFDPTPEGRQAYEAVVKAMADRPNIFVKLSEVYHRRDRKPDGTIEKDYAVLHDRLQYLYELFGDDRVLFGSDYPESYGIATIPEEAGLMKRFFADKPRAAQEKYFWRNSAKVYKWTPRTPEQPRLT